VNEILRRALLNVGLDEVDVAARLDVDPKTVRRWLEGRVPYNRHRWALADLLKLDEADLWPELRTGTLRPGELLAVYPHRASIKRETWRNLFASARHEIAILDRSSLFLAEDPEILRIFAERANDGVRVRIALGDPEGLETNDETLAVDVREALALYQPLRQVAGIEFRLHRIALYNSIYRAGNELFCHQHAYGVPASRCPILRLRCRTNDDMGGAYLDSFERIWNIASS
jgi:phosphatidylserine/phosphatidylglycerophosphate/cardiolipin synthase-like enzyme